MVSSDPLLLTVGASAATPLVDLVFRMCVELCLTIRSMLMHMFVCCVAVDALRGLGTRKIDETLEVDSIVSCYNPFV